MHNLQFKLISNCVLNQRCGYWLLSDALANAIKLCVKLISERLELEIQMNIILPFQFDAKLFLLASRMRLEVTHVLASFLDCLHQFDPKTMMLALMLNPIFKDLYILNNYVRIEKTTIVATKYNSETLIPLLCLHYIININKFHY